MGERSSYAPGTFSWGELTTSDGAAAKAFYGDLFGWALEDLPVPDSPPYTMASVGGRRVAAMYETSAADRPTAWLSYVTVQDDDASAARAGELGATAVQEPFDVLDAGRMAVLQDPTGAVFAIWQPRGSIGAELVNDVGAMCMNQLNTSDPVAAQAFYEGLFGWRYEQVAGGEQPFWSIYNGDTLNGGMMSLAPGSPAPSHWLAYFTVADLDASVAQIGALGGTVLVAPFSVPAGRFAVASDPQGGVFALFAGEVDP